MNTFHTKIHDYKNGLDYTLVGDYYLPDLGIESSQPIGKYGRARMKYLKEHRPGLYSRLLLSGKLYDDLHDADAEAQHLLDEMIPRMAAEAGVNEDLKATDPMRWVGMMNTIKVQVDISFRGCGRMDFGQFHCTIHHVGMSLFFVQFFQICSFIVKTSSLIC